MAEKAITGIRRPLALAPAARRLADQSLRLTGPLSPAANGEDAAERSMPALANDYPDSVHTDDPPVTRPFSVIRRTDAQKRILVAALDLFAEHGVSATSLRMIADEIGVTKAAIYFQFRSKKEIVIAVTEHELASLEDALTAAETEKSRDHARLGLLTSVIDMTVARRRWIRTLQNDPVIVRLLAEHEPFRLFVSRIYGVLVDEDDDTEDRMATAILSAAIGGAVLNPLVAEMDEGTLRASLLHFTRRMVNLPE